MEEKLDLQNGLCIRASTSGNEAWLTLTTEKPIVSWAIRLTPEDMKAVGEMLILGARQMIPRKRKHEAKKEVIIHDEAPGCQ
jgi:hypothetical protein